jgi:DNA polymerase alpha subunit B
VSCEQNDAICAFTCHFPISKFESTHNAVLKANSWFCGENSESYNSGIVLLQSQFVGVGRVCCDSMGRLNAKSLVLESFAGKTVPLDISQVENFSLFPGQVIVVEGDNPLGSKLSAKQIYSDASLPLPPKPSLSTEENGKQTCVESH